jgi:hypothetical protein
VTTTTIVFDLPGHVNVTSVEEGSYRYPSVGDVTVAFANGGRIFVPPSLEVLTSEGILQSVSDLVPGQSLVQYPIRTSLEEAVIGPDHHRATYYQVVSVEESSLTASSEIRPAFPIVPADPTDSPLPPGTVVVPPDFVDVSTLPDPSCTPDPTSEYSLPDFVARFEFKLSENTP